MIEREFKVYLGGTQGINQPIHLSQYDTEWRFIISVYNGDALWTIPSGTAALLEGRKLDGTVFAARGTIDGTTVVVDCPAQLSSMAGDVECELRFSASNGKLVGTANFTAKVEAAPLAGHTSSADDFSGIDQLLSQALIEAHRIGTTAEEIAKLKALVGTPLVATAKSGMTNHDKIYVYVNEDPDPGMTSGHWYYWDGSAWADGGIYNSAAVNTDTTMSVSGAAADAASVGSLTMMNRGQINSTYDLDDVGLRGLYYWIAGQQPTNSPVTNAACRMMVIGTNSGNLEPTNTPAVAQIVYVSGGRQFIRIYSVNGTWSSWKQVTTYEDLDDRTLYTVDTSAFGFGFGGLANTGGINKAKWRLRFLTPEGKGAFDVAAGSTISVASGYQFNVARYSRYKSSTDFTLKEYIPLRTTTYTVPEDSIIRVAFGRTDDAYLWSEDESGAKDFTAAGEAAKSAVTLTLLASTVKDKIDDLESRLGSQYDVMPLDEIPLNAVAYHELWDNAVEAGEVERTLLGNVGDDENLPVYMYKIAANMDMVNLSYKITPWDGTNELYKRPKVLITGGIHGNERTQPMAIWSVMDSILHDVRYRSLLNSCIWYVIPLVNPWGFSHTAFKNGSATQGKEYNENTKSTFDVRDNTAENHVGIRRVESGKDANRDFNDANGFLTEEAQFVRDAAASALETGESFAFVLDSHQAIDTGITEQDQAYDPDYDIVGAFLAVRSRAGTGGEIWAAARRKMFSKWMRAGAITEQLIADYVDLPVRQTIYTWGHATNQGTERTIVDYMRQYTDYSMCYEGGQTCTYYSGTKALSGWSNPIARALINTQYHNFIKILIDEMMAFEGTDLAM